MFSRLCPLTTFHHDAFRQTPNDRDAPLHYSQTASKKFYLSSAKRWHSFPKTFWIKVLLQWHYFVFPGKTCSCQCLTKVTWEPTEKPLGECLAGCDVGQTISVIDWGLFYIKNRRVLCDFILLIGISFYHYNIPKQRWHGRLCFLSSLFISRETPFSLDWNC